ncbi:hypothetical protein [Plantibacter sp. VKM Ac-2876]|uniref:hypothetical protein n=1 Tax=Plantibacter sp. VKM Ac-2876 TaxID=2783826 RepID=UPI00188BBED4|nr:hypothetical protein [Plantibacter sp. VKM Ac-2876]MBF4565402.1 hypothetical protein [Plantibacter sp. VKM Ac-2876]
MTASVQHGTTTIGVDFLLGFVSEREHGNILHPVLGRGDVEVTFKAAGLRKGTLKFLCDTYEKAAALDAEHAKIGSFQLLDDEVPPPGVSMTYVPAGRITVELDQTQYVVSVDFQEVLP